MDLLTENIEKLVLREASLSDASTSCPYSKFAHIKELIFSSLEAICSLAGEMRCQGYTLLTLLFHQVADKNNDNNNCNFTKILTRLEYWKCMITMLLDSDPPNRQVCGPAELMLNYYLYA